MRLLLFFLFVSTLCSGQATFHSLLADGTAWYVSASGSGSNTGHSSSSPLDLTTFLSTTINPGDAIYFAAGEIFFIEDYQLSDDNVLVSRYGSGADPVIIGSQDISGLTWTHEGSNLYSCPWATSDAKWVYVNGVAAKLAQTDWYKITSQSDGTHLTATTLNGAWGSTVSGSKVLVREWYFTYSFLRNVTAYSAGQITLDTAVRTGLTEFAFKLYDQLQFLNEVGEWFFDDAANKIYYKTAGGAPTDIRICTEDRAFTLPIGTDNVEIRDIEFTQYLVTAIQGRDVDGLTIGNCNIHDIRGNGLFIYGPGQDTHIHHNEFNRCEQNGMLLGGLMNPIVEFNDIDSSGIGVTHPFAIKLDTAVLSEWQQTTSSGIVFTYDRSNTTYHGVEGGIIRRNNINRSGYCGINFTGSIDSVSWNRVDSSMIGGVEDGAAIYCIGQPELSNYQTETIGTVIYKNIVTYFAGRYENCPLAHPDMNSWGIYIDKTCEAIVIKNNTLFGPNSGGLIKISVGNHDNIITDNTVIGAVQGVQFVHDISYPSNITNTLTGNMIATAWFPVSTRDLSNTFGGSYSPFSSGGDTDNNIYFNPYGDVVGRRLGSSPNSYTLSGWRALTSDDASSVVSPIATYTYTGNFASEQEIIVQLNETLSSVSFAVPTGFVSKTGVTAGNNVTIPAYEGVVFVRTSSIATVYDTFNGSNGTSISGRTPNVGGNWTLRNGVITITGNTMVSASNGNATVTTSNADVNIMVQAHKGSTGNINVLIRHNGLNGTSVEDYIWLFWGSDLISLIQHVGSTGVNTTLATAPQLLEVGTNYYVEAQVTGNRIKIKINNENRMDFTGLTMNPSSVIHGFRQTSGGASGTTTFATSSP